MWSPARYKKARNQLSCGGVLCSFPRCSPIVWQMFNVINIDGSLTCGVKICSSKKKIFFSAIFQKYIPRFAVLKLTCTLAALSTRCEVPLQNSVLPYFTKANFPWRTDWWRSKSVFFKSLPSVHGIKFSESQWASSHHTCFNSLCWLQDHGSCHLRCIFQVTASGEDAAVLRGDLSITALSLPFPVTHFPFKAPVCSFPKILSFWDEIFHA